VRHALLRRDLDAAQGWLMEAPIPAGLDEVQASHAAPSSEAVEWLALSHSRVFLASGRAAKAQNVLEPVLSAAIEGRRLLLEVRVRILLALALDGAGRLDLALDMAAMALRVGLAMGLRRSFLDEGSRFIEITQMVHERVLANQLPRAVWGSTLAALGDIELLGRSVRAPDAPPEAPTTEKRAAMLGTAVGTLKRRETEILHLLARGQSNKEIARSLDIGVDTVKWYLKSIYGKLGVTTRAAAVLAADRTVRFSDLGHEA
jgi:ATP/maltotriose-dependent transcriptional regulator MalT